MRIVLTAGASIEDNADAGDGANWIELALMSASVPPKPKTDQSSSVM